MERIMQTTTITNLISEYETLSYEDKEYVLELFKKQLIDVKRKLLENRVKEAEENYSEGSVSKGSIKELYSDLEND
jgi:hypothetical protein